MTIPAFTAGQVLDADALNAALGDAAQETLGADNTWTGTSDFEGGSVTVPDATAAQNPVTLNQMDDGSLSPTFDNLTVTGGLLKGFLAISTDTTLTADDVGKAIIVGGGPTITIPNLIPGLNSILLWIQTFWIYQTTVLTCISQIAIYTISVPGLLMVRALCLHRVRLTK